MCIRDSARTGRTGLAGARQCARSDLLPLNPKGTPMLMQDTPLALKALRQPGVAANFGEQQRQAQLAA